MKLKALDKDGESIGQLIKAKFDMFLKKYDIAKGNEKKILEYPARDISNTKLFAIMLTESYLTIIVIEFYKSRSPCDALQILEKPRKSVVVTAAVSKKELVIPIFGKISSVPKDSGIPDRTFEIKNCAHSDRLFFIKLDTFKENDTVALTPASYVQYTKDEGDVTAQVAWVSYGACKKIPKGELSRVKLPAIENTIALTPTDELKLLVIDAPPEKPKRDTMIIECSVPSKKQKSAPA